VRCRHSNILPGDQCRLTEGVLETEGRSSDVVLAVAFLDPAHRSVRSGLYRDGLKITPRWPVATRVTDEANRSRSRAAFVAMFGGRAQVTEVDYGFFGADASRSWSPDDVIVDASPKVSGAR
jgi:hypothetical protein